MNQSLAYFEKTGTKLRITPTAEGLELLRQIREDEGDDALSADALFWDFIEHELCNGWEQIRPEEIGALTEAPILSDDVERNDEGKLTGCGRVFWFPNYMILSPLREMLDVGFVEFHGVS